MKICNKCKQEREESDFKIRSNTGKPNTICIICQREYKLKDYYKNKKSYIDRNINTKKRNKEYILEFKSSNPCSNCGEEDPRCLDFHHIDPKSKVLEVSKLAHNGCIDLVKLEIKKCIMLCANCHRKLHSKL